MVKSHKIRSVVGDVNEVIELDEMLRDTDKIMIGFIRRAKNLVHTIKNGDHSEPTRNALDAAITKIEHLLSKHEAIEKHAIRESADMTSHTEAWLKQVEKFLKTAEKAHEAEKEAAVEEYRLKKQ